MYIRGSPADIQTPAHWSLIDHGMTSPQRVLSPSNILPPKSKVYYSMHFSFCEYCVNLKLPNVNCKSTGVSVLPVNRCDGKLEERNVIIYVKLYVIISIYS
jgi:hypothetical protein